MYVAAAMCSHAILLSQKLNKKIEFTHYSSAHNVNIKLNIPNFVY